LINPAILDMVSHMVDLKFQIPATEEVEVDSVTLARIDRGIKDADEGCTVPLEEVRKMISQWISKFESPKVR
jgi:predicted transcriptional regulator